MALAIVGRLEGYFPVTFHFNRHVICLRWGSFFYVCILMVILAAGLETGSVGDALVCPLVLFIFLLCELIQCLQLFLYLNYQDEAFSCSYQAYSLLGPTGSGSLGRTAAADMRGICRVGVRQHCRSGKWPLFNSTTLHFDYSRRFSASLRAIAFGEVQ